MAKIKSPKNPESAARRSKGISASTFDILEMKDFLHFVREEYVLTLTSIAAAHLEHHHLRDIAIISLSLGSGIRINEVAGLLTTDINLIHGDIHALRKGNKLDTISITDTTITDLKNYLDEREQLYRPDKKNFFVFLTKYRGKANQISVEPIEKLVKKNSEAFMVGKRLSPHKLHHSFAKGFIDKDGSLVPLLINWTIIQLRPLPSKPTLVSKSKELL